MRSRAGIEYGPKPITPLNKIKWDPVIEAKMQQFIEQSGEYQTIPSGTYSPYGYSSWLVSATNFKGYDTFMRSYNSSAPYYNFETSSCNEDKCCLMYATMMWNASTAMGCGFKAMDGSCGMRGWLLCGYNPAGSFCGVNPYTPAPPTKTPSTVAPTMKPTSTPSTAPTKKPANMPSPTTPTTKRPNPTPSKVPPTRVPNTKPTATPSNSEPNFNGNNIDWRTTGFVTNVKQMQCGSCYAFASVAALESAYLIKNNRNGTIDLSEQHAVNCAPGNGYDGCKGGSGDQVFSLLQPTGIAYENDIEYSASAQQCRKPSTSTVKYNGYVTVKPSKERFIDELKKGPFYVSYYSDDDNKSYSNGVFRCRSQSNQDTTPNHAVLLVGYSPSDDSWILKNSWGTGWGKAGYFKMASDSCNIFAYPGNRPVI
eukprot:gene19077-22843_t